LPDNWLFLGYGPIAEGLIRRGKAALDAKIVVSDQLNVQPKGLDFQLYKSGDFFKINSLELTIVLISWKEITTKRQFVLNELKKSLGENVLIINLSTAAIYGEGLNKNAYRSNPKPINQYGISKLQGEAIINDIFKNQVTHLRVSNLYGSLQFHDLVTKIINSIESNSKLLVYENGTILRDYVLLDDLLDFLFLLSEDQKYRKLASDFQFLDFATGHASNQSTLIQLVEVIMHGKVTNFQWEQKPHDMVTASSQEALELNAFFDFKTTPIEKGIERYLGQHCSSKSNDA
jgi:nucleoside-diphosphate-sugar epimerase